MPLIPDDVHEALSLIHIDGPLKTKANGSRIYADAIAEAASRGFITTLLDDEATRYWRLTPKGLAVLTMG
jgi:hypothetical protein